jgi:hypothetical protein
MTLSPAPPISAGLAFRLSLVLPQHVEAYENVFAQIDGGTGVVRVYSADGRTHYLSAPLSMTLIEWKDPAELDPQPRVPGFGAGALRRMGEEARRMSDEMGRVFGEG